MWRIKNRWPVSLIRWNYKKGRWPLSPLSKKLIKEKKELTDGYAYRFEGSDHNVDLLTDFIETERRRCDFFNFCMDVKNDETAWVKITGAKGIKGFITTEQELWIL